MCSVVFRRRFWVGLVMVLSFTGLGTTSSLAYSLSTALPPDIKSIVDAGAADVVCGSSPPPMLTKRKSSRNQDQYERQIQKWRLLPPEEKRKLRRKMHQWNQMSPESRMLYQQRFEQWQNLPPAERNQLRQQLEHWEQLSPNERENIRRKFHQP